MVSPSGKPEGVERVGLSILRAFFLSLKTRGASSISIPLASAISVMCGLHKDHVVTYQGGSHFVALIITPVFVVVVLTHLYGMLGPSALSRPSDSRILPQTTHHHHESRSTRPSLDDHGPIALTSSDHSLPDRRRVTDILSHDARCSGATATFKS